jgi:hypothetical protein
VIVNTQAENWIPACANGSRKRLQRRESALRRSSNSPTTTLLISRIRALVEQEVLDLLDEPTTGDVWLADRACCKNAVFDNRFPGSLAWPAYSFTIFCKRLSFDLNSSLASVISFVS